MVAETRGCRIPRYSIEDIVKPNMKMLEVHVYENILRTAYILRMYVTKSVSAFYDHYEEIMTYYKSKRKAKAELIDSLIEDKDLVWTSKLPVYSTQLRHFSMTQESLFFSSIDKQINPLVSISINLKSASMIEVPLYLYQAQMRVNELWNLNFALIEGKHGWIRKNVLGGDLNNTLAGRTSHNCRNPLKLKLPNLCSDA